MVKYGRHLEFLRQRFQKSAYLVDYKAIQRVVDRAAFSADWQEGLARATAAKEEGVAGLWSRVFQGIATVVDADQRGVRPLVALHTYHASVSAADTQRLLDDYSELRMAAVANWEALRKLVKKFDKNAPEDQALSGELLPKLYASSLTSLVHADDDFPFEKLKVLAHPLGSTGGEAEADEHFSRATHMRTTTTPISRVPVADADATVPRMSMPHHRSAGGAWARSFLEKMRIQLPLLLLPQPLPPAARPQPRGALLPEVST